MSNDLRPALSFRFTVAVVKVEPLALPRSAEVYRTAELPVVITEKHNDVAQGAELLQKHASLGRCRFIVRQVTDDNQMQRLMLANQCRQPIVNGGHPPQRHQPTSDALADLVAEVQVSYRQPPLFCME